MIANVADQTTESYLEINNVAEKHLGEYRCIASFLADLSVYQSNYASLDLLGFVDTVSDIVVTRDDTPHIKFSVR